MPLFPSSPVPPADGIVTDERLGALLALGTEYDELDFKGELDPTETKDAVELAKDVGAFQVKGGYIVAGVDDTGGLTGALDSQDLGPFDAARLVPMMQRYIEGALDLSTGVLTREGHVVVLICVKPHPRGCAFFRIEGVYRDERRDRDQTVFRPGEVFWRENTRSKRVSSEGLDAIIERRFAAKRDELLREWAAAQRALRLGEPSSSLPSTTFSVSEHEVVANATRLLRTGDETGLRQLLDDGGRQLRMAIDSDRELAEGALPLLLDGVVCLAATFLSVGADTWFERALQLLVDAYAWVADAQQVERFGISTAISPQEKAPRVWLATIERVYALGGFAVRRECWEAVRALATQLPHTLAAKGYERNWLRHAVTMSSRAQLYSSDRGAPAELSLIDLARDDAARLDYLRSDGIRPDDERLLTSIVQFDVLSILAAIDDAHSTEGRVFYTNFARFRQDRIQPAVERLLNDTDMRSALFHGSDEELAVAIAAVDAAATTEGAIYGGHHSFQGTSVGGWVLEHWPPDRQPQA